MSIIEKDPVCGMVVDAHKIEIVYAGIHFAFCSNQCRERFEANPHLYIGHPGHKAPKQKGVQVAKRRRFRLEQSLTPTDAKVLAKELDSMMGIREVHVDDMIIDVTYDLMEATAEQIEGRLVEIGLKLGGKWPERLRRGFVHFLEETEVSSLEELPHKHLHS
ncbi:MAG: YHS domain-containing protein [Methylotenera sp.]|nr:YHS domain-containing protein [Methylotenera sp.]